MFSLLNFLRNARITGYVMLWSPPSTMGVWFLFSRLEIDFSIFWNASSDESNIKSPSSKNACPPPKSIPDSLHRLVENEYNASRMKGGASAVPFKKDEWSSSGMPPWWTQTSTQSTRRRSRQWQRVNERRSRRRSSSSLGSPAIRRVVLQDRSHTGTPSASSHRWRRRLSTRRRRNHSRTGKTSLA